MQNRFGFKDLVVLIAVIATAVSVWLSMVQSDRRWKQSRDISTSLEEIERQAARVQRTLDDSGVAGLGARVEAIERRLNEVKARLEQGVTVSGAASAPSDTKGVSTSTRDTAWAVEGVPIAWQPELRHGVDPAQVEGYRNGGAVTEIFNAQAQNVMPLIYKDVYGAYIYERIGEFLAEWNPATLQLRGVLAEAWQMDPAGQWLRARIRPQARFSDGEPVKAEDVVWTFNFMRNPQVQAERPRSITDTISEVVALDERTVEFRFNQVIFTNLSAAMNTFVILPKHFYEKFTPTQYNKSTGLVVGSGPFKFATLSPEWAPGQDVVLVRNEQYWGPRPAYDSLRFKFISNDLSRVTAFNNGEGDITTPSSTQFKQFSGRPEWIGENDARQWFNVRGGYNFIGWNCGQRNRRPTPFADKRVRRAMTMMLDREMIVNELFEGYGRVSTGPFNSVTEQANPGILPLPYDVAGARKLLEEAGWKDRDGNGVIENEAGQEFEFEFTYAIGNETTDKLVKYTKDQAAKLGIRVSLRQMDWSVFMSTVDNRDYDAMTMGWSPSSPESDPQQLWHSRYIDNQGDNFVQWANAEADEMIEKGRRELDAVKRMQYWHRLHAIIHEDQPYTFMVERPWLRFVSKRLGNFQEYKKGFGYGELFVRGGSAGAPSN